MDNEKQNKLSEFVSREVIYNQSYLVEELLKKEVLEYDDIINLEETNEEGDNVAKEIFEWWLVSDWLLEKLEAQGELILESDYGSWWGRCCTGQAIMLDSIIEHIYDEMMQ